MSEIETFKTRGQRNREDRQAEIVAILENALKRARAGEFSGIAIATAAAFDNRPDAEWAGWSASALGNAVASLSHRYFTAQARKQ